MWICSETFLHGVRRHKAQQWLKDKQGGMRTAKQRGWEMKDTDSAVRIVKDLKGNERQFTFY